MLDAGCGSGDVAPLAGEIVGPSGVVVGVDRAAAAIVRAKERADGQRMSNLQFVEGDPTVMKLNEGFDAVVDRLILMYYPDPIDALRRLLVQAVAEVVPSLLPVMERFGIATAAEVEIEIDSLAQRIRNEVLPKDGVVITPLLIGAWARHPA